MKTFEKLEDRHVKRPETLPPSRHRNRDPKRAAAMSVVPGLGQLYNGETGKGLLFLAATIANLVLFLMIFCTEPVMKGVIHVGSFFHLTPSADMNRILQIVHGSPTVCVLYIGLILAFIAYSMNEAYDHAKQLEKGRVFAPFFLGLSEATSGSFLLHFAIMFVGIIMVAFCAAPLPSKNQPTDIQLIPPEPPPEPPKPKEPDPPKPEKPPEPKKVEVKKPEPKKVEPPKPTPVAVAIPVKEPIASPIVQSNEPAPEAPSATSNATESNGSPSGTGEPTGNSGGDGEDVDFGSYLAEVQKRIKKAWFPPRGPDSRNVTLKFKVRKDGTVATIKLVTSSGTAMMDDAAKTAVKSCSPFPPLPPGSPDDGIDIKFEFDYNVFNGKGGGASTQ